MLAIECLRMGLVSETVGKEMLCHTDPGYHRMDGSEVSATTQTAVHAGACQVTSIAHAHGEKVLSGGGLKGGMRSAA